MELDVLLWIHDGDLYVRIRQRGVKGRRRVFGGRSAVDELCLCLSRLEAAEVQLQMERRPDKKGENRTDGKAAARSFKRRRDKATDWEV